MKRSPVWYRWRALTIGLVYFAGFFFVPLFTSLLVPASTGARPLATLQIVGRALGPNGHRILLVLAVLLCVTCWWLRVWGSAYLKPAVVWNADALDGNLIVQGPFRFVRNPLYLGNILLSVAMSVFAVPIGSAIIIIGNVLVSYALISVEQPLLRERYGAAFDAYAKNVPALFPRLVPWKGAQSIAVAPAFLLALRSELMTAGFSVSSAVAAFHFW